MKRLTSLTGLLLAGAIATPPAAQIVHDAEYYIIEAQHGERWKAQDAGLGD